MVTPQSKGTLILLNRDLRIRTDLREGLSGHMSTCMIACLIVCLSSCLSSCMSGGIKRSSDSDQVSKELPTELRDKFTATEHREDAPSLAQEAQSEATPAAQAVEMKR